MLIITISKIHLNNANMTRFVCVCHPRSPIVLIARQRNEMHRNAHQCRSPRGLCCVSFCMSLSLSMPTFLSVYMPERLCAPVTSTHFLYILFPIWCLDIVKYYIVSGLQCSLAYSLYCCCCCGCCCGLLFLYHILLLLTNYTQTHTQKLRTSSSSSSSS